MGICIQPSANQYLCLGKKCKIVVIENDGKVREIIKTKQNKPSKPRRIFEGYSCQLLAFMLGALVQKAGQESGINLRKNRFTAELFLRAQKNIRPQTSNKHSSFIFQYKCNC